MYMKTRCETALPVCVYTYMNTGCTVATALVGELPYVNVCLLVFVATALIRMRYPDNNPHCLFGCECHVEQHSCSLSNTVSPLRNIILQPLGHIYWTSHLPNGRSLTLEGIGKPLLTASLIKER